MPEQVQKVLDRILEWWKKFNTKQKCYPFSYNFNTILYISQTILLLFYALTDYFVSAFRFLGITP